MSNERNCKERTEYEILLDKEKVEQVKEDQASREAKFYTPDTPNVTLDFSQVYFKEVSDEKHAKANHPWDRMDKHDVIDPLAGVMY